MAQPLVPEPREVTLADIVRVLWRWRYVFLAVFLVTVAAGVAYAALKQREYTASGTIVAVEHQDVIQRWLESRRAAIAVAERVGDPLLSRLYPAEWDGAAWRGEPPSPERAAGAISSLVTVAAQPRTTGPTDRTLKLTVTFPDPGLARDIANAYLASLDVIRPQLQNVTESQLFVQFYDGQNEPDARRQAHQVALEREYWLLIDPAYAPQAPSSPNVRLTLALCVVLGLLLAVLAAFAAQWVASYRMGATAPSVPPPPSPAVPGSPSAPGAGAGFRYRGR